LEYAQLKARRQAQRQAQRRPQLLEGLSKHQGKLLIPTKGKLRRLFGDRRQGQVRWKGVKIDGRAGSPVMAIHYAKVLYADWLRGFGLVTVLDHGDGYMSLYGHNQALLHQAGDYVEAGETIALVGQSGGQSKPNLYFEIRHKGKPINPTKWLKL
jgi:septal ring factor EnvC (AmiA/AmiB activator)